MTYHCYSIHPHFAVIDKICQLFPQITKFLILTTKEELIGNTQCVSYNFDMISILNQEFDTDIYDCIWEEICEFSLPLKSEKVWLGLDEDEKNEIKITTGLDLFDSFDVDETLEYCNEFKFVTINASTN